MQMGSKGRKEHSAGYSGHKWFLFRLIMKNFLRFSFLNYCATIGMCLKIRGFLQVVGLKKFREGQKSNA